MAHCDGHTEDSVAVALASGRVSTRHETGFAGSGSDVPHADTASLLLRPLYVVTCPEKSTRPRFDFFFCDFDAIAFSFLFNKHCPE